MLRPAGKRRLTQELVLTKLSETHRDTIQTAVRPAIRCFGSPTKSLTPIQANPGVSCVRTHRGEAWLTEKPQGRMQLRKITTVQELLDWR